MLDVYVLPISLESGKETPDLPGFYVVASPRNANRYRSDEVLILFLNINENAAVPLSRLQGFFDNLVSTYFKTPGAVTAAIRALIKQLNDALLKSNLNKAREGKQTIAVLNLAVVHKEQIYIVHGGDTHSLLLSPHQVEDFHHPQPAAHGLGLQDNPDLNYYQSQVQPGCTLVLSTSFPEGFVNNLPTGGGRISIEQLRRRLNNQPDEKTRVAILQFQNGKGEVHYLKPRGASADAEIPDPLAAFPESSQPTPPPTNPISPPLAHPAPEESTVASRHSAKHEPQPHRPPPHMARPSRPDEKLGLLARIRRTFSGSHPVASSRPASAPLADQSAPPQTSHPAAADTTRAAFFPVSPSSRNSSEELPASPVGASPDVRSTADSRQTAQLPAAPQLAPLDKIPWQKWFSSLFKGSQKTGGKIKSGSNQMLVRMLPGDQDQLPQMSPSLMLVIAIAVPLIIAAVAVTIYYQLGPQKEYQDQMNQAEKTAATISTITDPILQISAMDQTIGYLDLAEKHLVTDQSKSLRRQIQNGLDDIYGIKRINYQQISDNIDPSVKITRILSNATDTYLLDSSQGRIFRMIQNAQHYRIDPTFDCSPGQVGVSHVDKLVDFVLLPANAPNKASVMGIDHGGNLLYCIPGEKPLAKSLTPPDMGWVDIKGMIIDEDGLIYVMDVSSKSVYIYLQQNFAYPDPPRLYFNDQIPTDMAGMVDQSINRKELYLLNADGHMVHCIFRAYSDSQTRCTDPTPYHDDRPGRTPDSNRMEGTNFTRLFVVGVPDPSIFALDAASSSLYQLSLRLTFYRQMQMQLYPDYRKPVLPASAFTISPARIIWIAYGNEVFYGLLP